MKVAIVHDWLVGGGAEKVVQQLHKMFPEAPVFTSYCTNEWRQKLDNKVVTGFLQYWPFSKLRKFIPILRVWWFKNLDLSDYELIISSSGAEAKFVKAKAGSVHIAYIHAPTHYYWSRYDEYLKNPGFGAFDWLARLGLKLLVGPLRRLDYEAAQKPNHLIANSNHIKAEIKKYYGRDSVVVHPPVDTKRFDKVILSKKHGFVAAGRQTPYKRIDLAVAVCSKLGLDLVVVGGGPDHQKLVKMAGPTVKFIENPSDQDVVKFLGAASAFIFPGLDDFGITPVEAMAAGTPVIAYKAGGALDYVKDGVSGTFFDNQTTESLAEALKNFKPENYHPDDIKSIAKSFSIENFHKNLQAFISRVIK